ncbi:MAG: hypothetical protein ACTSRP_26155 [Candidatus Helarchaeota archaeon]
MKDSLYQSINIKYFKFINTTFFMVNQDINSSFKLNEEKIKELISKEIKENQVKLIDMQNRMNNYITFVQGRVDYFSILSERILSRCLALIAFIFGLISFLISITLDPDYHINFSGTCIVLFSSLILFIIVVLKQSFLKFTNLPEDLDTIWFYRINDFKNLNSNKEDSEYNKFLKKIKEITDFIADDKKELFILNCYLIQYRDNSINLARWFKNGIICLIMSIIMLKLDIFNISSLSFILYIIIIISLIILSFILETECTKKQQMIDDKKKEYSKWKRLKNYLRTCFLKKSEFNDKMSKLSQED